MATTAWAEALPRPRARRPWARRPVRAVAVVVGLLIAELAVAAIIVEPRLLPLLALLGVAGGAMVMFRFPLLVLGGLLLASASVLHPRYFPEVSQARLPELVLVGLLGVAVVRPRRASWGGASGGALLAFFIVLAVTQGLAALDGRVEPIEAASWTRPLLLVAAFWVVVRLVPDRRTVERVVIAGAVVAGITAVLSASAATEGIVGQLFQDPGRQYVSDGTGLGLGVLERVRFPGMALCYGFFWPLTVLAIRARGAARWLLLGLLGLMVMCLGLTLWRNVWLGVFFGFLLLVVLGGVQLRGQLLKSAAVAVATVLVLSLGAGAAFSTERDSVLRPVIERASTLFTTPKNIGSREKNVQSRATETRFALQTVGSHLVTGIGGGVQYGMWFKEARSGGRYVRVPQKFLHNQWLWLVLVGGVPLMLLWAGFLVSTLRVAWTGPRDPLTTALGIGLACIMLSALVELFFSTEGMTLTIGVLAGLIHVARRTAGEDAGAVPGVA